MSGIYKKEITTTHSVEFIKCDMCGCETQFVLAMDNWCVIENKNYCMKCQKEHSVGWYKKQ